MADLENMLHWDEVEVPDGARKSWQAALGYRVATRAERLWEGNEDWRALLADRYEQLATIFNGNTITSPIELTMLGWLLFLDGDWHGFPDATHEPRLEAGYKFDKDEMYFGVACQASVKPYRLDFLIVVNGCHGTKRLAIECDGHDFHEKTKEQAAKDKKRDRDLLLRGIPMMRFTGSEIYRTPEACFEQIQEAVYVMVSDCGPWVQPPAPAGA